MYVSNVSFNRNSSKKGGFRKTENASDLYSILFPEPTCLLEVTLSAHAQCALPAHSAEIKQSRTASFDLVLLFFSYFGFACTFLFCILLNTKKKYLKCRHVGGPKIPKNP